MGNHYNGSAFRGKSYMKREDRRVKRQIVRRGIDAMMAGRQYRPRTGHIDDYNFDRSEHLMRGNSKCTSKDRRCKNHRIKPPWRSWDEYSIIRYLDFIDDEIEEEWRNATMALMDLDA